MMGGEGPNSLAASMMGGEDAHSLASMMGGEDPNSNGGAETRAAFVSPATCSDDSLVARRPIRSSRVSMAAAARKAAAYSLPAEDKENRAAPNGGAETRAAFVSPATCSEVAPTLLRAHPAPLLRERALTSRAASSPSPRYFHPYRVSVCASRETWRESAVSLTVEGAAGRGVGEVIVRPDPDALASASSDTSAIPPEEAIPPRGVVASALVFGGVDARRIQLRVRGPAKTIHWVSCARARGARTAGRTAATPSGGVVDVPPMLMTRDLSADDEARAAADAADDDASRESIMTFRAAETDPPRSRTSGGRTRDPDETTGSSSSPRRRLRLNTTPEILTPTRGGRSSGGDAFDADVSATPGASEFFVSATFAAWREAASSSRASREDLELVYVTWAGRVRAAKTRAAAFSRWRLDAALASDRRARAFSAAASLPDSTPVADGARFESPDARDAEAAAARLRAVGAALRAAATAEGAAAESDRGTGTPPAPVDISNRAPLPATNLGASADAETPPMARVAGARLFSSTVKQSAEDAEDACSASLRSPSTPSSVTSASAIAAADALCRLARVAASRTLRAAASGALRAWWTAAARAALSRRLEATTKIAAEASFVAASRERRRDATFECLCRRARDARAAAAKRRRFRAWRASTEETRVAARERDAIEMRRAVHREASKRVARVAFRAWRLVRHRAVRGAGALRARSEARVRFRVGATAFEGWRRVAESGRVASRGAVDAAKLALDAAAARETARLRLARRAARFAGRVASRRAARAFERWRDVRTTRHRSNARATRFARDALERRTSKRILAFGLRRWCKLASRAKANAEENLRAFRRGERAVALASARSSRRARRRALGAWRRVALDERRARAEAAETTEASERARRAETDALETARELETLRAEAREAREARAMAEARADAEAEAAREARAEAEAEAEAARRSAATAKAAAERAAANAAATRATLREAAASRIASLAARTFARRLVSSAFGSWRASGASSRAERRVLETTLRASAALRKRSARGVARLAFAAWRNRRAAVRRRSTAFAMFCDGALRRVRDRRAAFVTRAAFGALRAVRDERAREAFVDRVSTRRAATLSRRLAEALVFSAFVAWRDEVFRRVVAAHHRRGQRLRADAFGAKRLRLTALAAWIAVARAAGQRRDARRLEARREQRAGRAIRRFAERRREDAARRAFAAWSWRAEDARRLRVAVEKGRVGALRRANDAWRRETRRSRRLAVRTAAFERRAFERRAGRVVRAWASASVAGTRRAARAASLATRARVRRLDARIGARAFFAWRRASGASRRAFWRGETAAARRRARRARLAWTAWARAAADATRVRRAFGIGRHVQRWRVGRVAKRAFEAMRRHAASEAATRAAREEEARQRRDETEADAAEADSRAFSFSAAAEDAADLFRGTLAGLPSEDVHAGFDSPGSISVATEAWAPATTEETPERRRAAEESREAFSFSAAPRDRLAAGDDDLTHGGQFWDPLLDDALDDDGDASAFEPPPPPRFFLRSVYTDLYRRGRDGDDDDAEIARGTAASYSTPRL